MPRPSPAILATLLLAGLVAAPTGVAQGIPGVPMVVEDTRPQRPAAPAPQQATGKLLDRVVAIVNEGIITQSELDEAVAGVVSRARQEGRQLPPSADDVRNRVLSQLVEVEVQMQRAERIGLKITEDDIQSALRRIAEANNLTLAQLPDALARQGIDFTEFREGIHKEMVIDYLREREVVRHINVSPRELDQFIERLKKLPNENDDYDVSDILIELPSEPTRAEIEQQRKKAQDIHVRAATEDFASLAIAHSDAGTALEGGKLGLRKGSELPSDIAEAIVALKPGEVSSPFQTANGFHIVKLNAVRRAEGDPVQDQVRVRHILLKTDALQDDGAVRLRLAGLRQQIIDGADFAAFAKMSRDTASAADGGELDWYSPDNFEIEFADAVKGMKENDISEPFKTRHGWHIVQLLERRRFDTTEDALRDRAFRQLRVNKAEQEVALWLKQLRDETFIDTTL